MNLRSGVKGFEFDDLISNQDILVWEKENVNSDITVCPDWDKEIICSHMPTLTFGLEYFMDIIYLI